MSHLVRSTLTKSGATRRRPGPWHVAEFGPVTLCGDELQLSTVHRLDLTRPRLLGPDVCTDCLSTYAPELVAESQRKSDAGDELDDDDGGQLGTLTESRPASDTSEATS